MAPETNQKTRLSVFFSYSHRDEQGGGLSSLVKRAVEASDDRPVPYQLDLFVDESGILPGSQWRETIDARLAETSILLPCITLNYCLSKECAYEYARFDELARSSDGTRFCVPLFWEDISDEFLELRSFHKEVLNGARGKDGVELAGLLSRQTSARRLVEELVVADVSDALCRTADTIMSNLAERASVSRRRAAHLLSPTMTPTGGDDAEALAQRAKRCREDGQWAEAARLYRSAIDKLEGADASDARRGELWWWLAIVREKASDREGRELALREAVRAYRTAGDDKSRSTCLGILADALREQQRADEAAALYCEAIDAGQGSGQTQERLGRYCWWLGGLYRDAGDTTAALAQFRAAVEHYREAGREVDLSTCLGLLADLLRELSRTSEALAAYQEAVDIGARAGQSPGRLGRYCWQLATIFQNQGDAVAARALYREAAEHYRCANDLTRLATCLYAVSLLCDDPTGDEALAALDECFRIRSDLYERGQLAKDVLDRTAERLALLATTRFGVGQ